MRDGVETGKKTGRISREKNFTGHRELRAIFGVFVIIKGFLRVWLFNGIKYLFC